MKKRILILLLIFTIALGICAVLSQVALIPVSGAETEAAELTVFLLYEETDGSVKKETPLEGAEVLLYKVGALSGEGGNIHYRLEAPFQNSGVDLDNMTASKSLQAAEILFQIIQEEGTEPFSKGVTDSGGRAFFQDLESGCYLGVQKRAVSAGDKTVYFSPSLWMVPEGEKKEDGTITWKTVAQVYPKLAPHVREKTTTPTTRPPEPTTRVTTERRTTATTRRYITRRTATGTTSSRTGANVKTGDETHILLYAGLVLASACLIGILIVRSRKGKKDGDQ